MIQINEKILNYFLKILLIMGKLIIHDTQIEILKLKDRIKIANR